MVNRIILAVTALALVFGGAGIVSAANPDTGPGCGLGKLAWSDYAGQKQIAPQVLMATTNGTFGSTTFGISTGTSGCTNDGTIMASEKVNVFAASNFDNISQEMAQGQGEHLTSLATLMGIPEDDHQEFFSMTQAEYTSLVQNGESSPKAVIKAIYTAMEGHPVLAQANPAK